MSVIGIRTLVETHLSGLEKREDIRILYAVESGSRAWGFPSPDSDYDIRFIYVRRLEWYLSIQPKRDVLESMEPNDLDFAGWDLPKTLSLLRKSNPALIEWLNSPIVYRSDDGFLGDLRQLADRCVSLETCLRHYVSMAKSNYETYFTEPEVRLKKYFYVLRPLFACQFIEQHRSVPPVDFHDLLKGIQISGDLRNDISELLAAKSQMSEIGVGLRRTDLDQMIETELARFQGTTVGSAEPADYREFDQFLLKVLSTDRIGNE